MSAISGMKQSVEMMRAEVARLSDEIEKLARLRYRVEAGIHEAQGESLQAEWCRLMADGERERAHDAWLSMMAEIYLRFGRHLNSLMAPDMVETRRAIELRAAEMQKEAGHAA